MSEEEFKNTNWRYGMQASNYNGTFEVIGVDFEAKTVKLDVYGEAEDYPHYDIYIPEEDEN